jgi:hypothetical protein
VWTNPPSRPGTAPATMSTRPAGTPTPTAPPARAGRRAQGPWSRAGGSGPGVPTSGSRNGRLS